MRVVVDLIERVVVITYDDGTTVRLSLRDGLRFLVSALAGGAGG
jgi:hypothetical protein